MLVLMNTQPSSLVLNPQPSGVLRHDGAEWAVLLLHGFTGGPDSVLPWGHALAAAGATVYIPLLAGHGTSVSDLARTTAGQWRFDVQQSLDHLLCDQFDGVAIAGLSMGGTLALDAAAHRRVDATFVVNPALSFKCLDGLGVAVSPLIQRWKPTVGPLAGDVHKPGVSELAYDSTPVSAVQELAKLCRVTRRMLPQIQSPVTLYRSETDHIVPASSSRILTRGLQRAQFDKIVLKESYHVATLDYDAETIHRDSVSRLLILSGGLREP